MKKIKNKTLDKDFWKRLLYIEKEGCANCGHSKRYHHLVGVGFPVEYIDECMQNSGSFKFSKCKCRRYVEKAGDLK